MSDPWRRHANALFAAGKESASLALLASFSAPLMRYSNEGAAIISLIGAGSTQALRAATSVWYEATEVDVDHSGNMPHLMVCPDLGNRDPDIIRDFIYSVTAARSILLAASVKSVTVVMPDVDARSRIIELFVPYMLVPLEMEANRGVAGLAFKGYIEQPDVADVLAQIVPQWTKELWVGAGSKREHRYWAVTFGAICAAASIAAKLDLIAFSPSRIAKLARDYMAGTTLTTKIPSIAGEALAAFIIKYAGDSTVIHRDRQGNTLIRRAEFHRFLNQRKLDGQLIRDELLRLKYLKRWKGQCRFGRDRPYDAATVDLDNPGLAEARLVLLDVPRPQVAPTPAAPLSPPPRN